MVIFVVFSEKYDQETCPLDWTELGFRESGGVGCPRPSVEFKVLFLYRGFKFVLLFWSTVIAQRFGIANMKSNAHLNLQ